MPELLRQLRIPNRYTNPGTALTRRKGVEEKRMFGGICFPLNGNLLVGVWKDALIARLGLDEGQAALREPHVRVFDITGKPMRNWVAVEPKGVEDDEQLHDWTQRALRFVGTLPAKWGRSVAGEFKQVIPIMRIFEVEKAKDFYLGFLGFTVDWEHPFGENTPAYLQVSRARACSGLAAFASRIAVPPPGGRTITQRLPGERAVSFTTANRRRRAK